MSRRHRRKKNTAPVLAWWGVLGVGLGLVVVAGLVGWGKVWQSWERAQAVDSDLRRLAPVLVQIRAGQPPQPEVLAQVEASELAPLLGAMREASRQRRQALQAYQSEIEAVGLGEGLNPAILVAPEGRQRVRQKLAQLGSALEVLIQQDGAIQGRLDQSIATWLKQTPSWGDPDRRQALQAASAHTVATMASFFEVERSIVRQVDALLTHLDGVGPQLTLAQGDSPQLLFTNPQDQQTYRAHLVGLVELGRGERELLVKAVRAGGLHARQVSDVLLASLEQPEP